MLYENSTEYNACHLGLQWKTSNEGYNNFWKRTKLISFGKLYYKYKIFDVTVSLQPHK